MYVQLLEKIRSAYAETEFVGNLKEFSRIRLNYQLRNANAFSVILGHGIF